MMIRRYGYSEVARMLALVTGWGFVAVVAAQTTVTETARVDALRVAAENQSDWTATILLAAGIMLLLLEIKIVSQGILGFLGASSLVAATVIIWRDGTPFWGIPVGWIVPSVVVILVITGLLAWLSIQAQQEKVVGGYQGFVGEIAEAREALDPEGRVFFNGTYWQAVSRVPVAPGDKVRVVAADRLKLVVEPIGVDGE